ncbi:ABC transporter substrate-binding protein [Clostridium sp. AN503]|uniref:ABC transporter substrate-binding protein n=1 Tax=Clostridium sp. AN503 TaxID=3160598 RepID=UPI0034593C7F
MLKRYLAGIALLTMITVSGCSTKATETSSETNASKVSASETNTDAGTSSDVLEIEFWHALENQYQATLNRVISDFNNTHDDMVVKPLYIGNYTALNEAIVSANAAETSLPGVAMANIPYVTAYGAGGLCEDLGPYIQRDNFEIDDFGEGLIQAAKYEDTQVALPFLVSTEVIYYNRDKMNELGLEIPETWNELPRFLEQASDVAADGTTNRYGMVFPGWITWYYEPFFINNGVSLVTAEGTTDLASENSVKVVSDIKDWAKKGYTYLATGEDAASVMRQNFIDGKALSVVYTSSLYDTIVDSCSFDVGMAWLPGGETKEQVLGGNVLFLPAKNDQKIKDASWEFLSYLMSKEVNMIWASESGYLPTRKSVQETDEGKAFLKQKPEFQIIFDNLDIITPGIQRTDWSQVSTAWRNWMDEIIQEDLDVEASLKEMEVEINEILSGS